MDTSIKRTQTPKKYLKWSFLLLPTCIKWTLVIKFHHPTCQTPEMRKIATHKFFNFYLKNVTWRTYLISFTVQYCFLFRFVCIELMFHSSARFLQIWVALKIILMFNGTMISWSTLIKKLMHVYRHSLWEYSKHFYCSLIWMVLIDTSYDRYLSKTVLCGHPVLSGHCSIPRGCPLNTGFTVYQKWPIGKNVASGHRNGQGSCPVSFFFSFRSGSFSTA